MTEPTLALPEGQTCADCFHFRRCAWLLSRRGPETECDWYPIRFAGADPPDNPERRDLKRDTKLEADRGDPPLPKPPLDPRD